MQYNINEKIKRFREDTKLIVVIDLPKEGVFLTEFLDLLKEEINKLKLNNCKVFNDTSGIVIEGTVGTNK